MLIYEESDDRPRSSARRSRINLARREELLEQLEEALLADGFTSSTMDDLARTLNCSKGTLYSLAATKEQLVVRVTKRFFARAADEIERAVAAEPEVRQRIATYLSGVGTAMRQPSANFYADMVGNRFTAEIYRANSDAAAKRVQELIDDGVRAGVFRSVDGEFAGHLIALAIDGIQSGTLLRATGLAAGDAFAELGDLLLNGLSASPRVTRQSGRRS